MNVNNRINSYKNDQSEIFGSRNPSHQQTKTEQIDILYNQVNNHKHFRSNHHPYMHEYNNTSIYGLTTTEN